MTRFRKDFNLEILLIEIAFLFFCSNVVYCAEVSNRAFLRVPLIGNAGTNNRFTALVYQRYLTHLEGDIPNSLKKLEYSLEWPVIGYIWHFDNTTYFSGPLKLRHRGIDILAQSDTPVKTVFDGRVIDIGWAYGGNAVYVRSDNGLIIAYTHVYEDDTHPIPKKGQKIKAGNFIGKVFPYPRYFSAFRENEDENTAPSFDREQPAEHFDFRTYYVSPEISDDEFIKHHDEPETLYKDRIIEINPLLLLRTLEPQQVVIGEKGNIPLSHLNILLQVSGNVRNNL